MTDSKAGVLDAHSARVAETHLASRGLWLVKVPKYLAEKMKKANGPIGKIKTVSNPGKKPEVLFCTNDTLSDAGDQTPTTHQFIMSSKFSQELTVLSETENGRLVMEGKVMQRMECRPHATQNYMTFKGKQVTESNKPKRCVIELDKPVNPYKPVETHDFIRKHEAQKKAEGKRSRDDEDKVQEVLFKAFEKHQYYSLRDLHLLTKQPLQHLKEILHKICIYNVKAPHKSMWELKAEYRHYNADEGGD